MPGHRGLHDRVHAALETCIERADVEFKASGEFRTLEQKIVKTAIAMANLRDGGIIVIGVSERDDAWQRTGIRDEDLATWNPDDLTDAINRYASPPVSVDLVLVPHGETRFLAIQVREFRDTPIVCKRDGGPNSGLRQGVLYVRPAGTARTSEVRTAEDMHDLLELAAEKRARRILETARRIGLEAPPARRPFDDELEGL